MKQTYVKDWMTRDLITVTSDTTLAEAHRLMSGKQVRRLPVVENNRLIGIVTRGDMREADPSRATSLSSWELNELFSTIKIGEIMTVKPKTISQDATIGEAAEIMLESKISGLPVVDGQGKLVGIITESDIFRVVVQGWRQADS